jgi:hypothetical protein
MDGSFSISVGRTQDHTLSPNHQWLSFVIIPKETQLERMCQDAHKPLNGKKKYPRASAVTFKNVKLERQTTMDIFRNLMKHEAASWPSKNT